MIPNPSVEERQLTNFYFTAELCIKGRISWSDVQQRLTLVGCNRDMAMAMIRNYGYKIAMEELITALEMSGLEWDRNANCTRKPTE